MGLRLIKRPTKNLEVLEYRGLLVKGSYWLWPGRNQAGNAIDFFVKVLGLSFNIAMREILASQPGLESGGTGGVRPGHYDINVAKRRFYDSKLAIGKAGTGAFQRIPFK